MDHAEIRDVVLECTLAGWTVHPIILTLKLGDAYD